MPGSVRQRRKNGKNGMVPQPSRKRGLSRLSYLRALRRVRLLLRELRRLERPERTIRWDIVSPGAGTRGAGGSSRGRKVVLLDTAARKMRIEPNGRITVAGRMSVLVVLSDPFSSFLVRWTGLRRTTTACREAATVLEVMAT